MSRIGRTRRILLFWAAAALIAALESILTAAWLVGGTSPRVYSSLEAVPSREIGMVLGSTKYSLYNGYYKEQRNRKVERISKR